MKMSLFFPPSLLSGIIAEIICSIAQFLIIYDQLTFLLSNLDALLHAFIIADPPQFQVKSIDPSVALLC